LDLRHQLAILRARLPLILAVMVIVAGGSFGYSSLQPKVYEAGATLVVGQSLSSVNPDYTALLASQSLSTTYATVATTRPLLQNVIESLGLPGTTDDLARRVSASAAIGSTILSITAEDGDPAQAAAIANALADQLIAASPAVQGRQTGVQKFVDADLQATQAQIQAAQTEANTLGALTTRTPVQDARLATLQAELTSLQSSYATLLGFSSSGSANLLSIIQPAVAPTAPISPRPLLNALLAIVLGLMLVAAAVFLFAYLDDTVQTPEVVEELTGLPTLGTVLRMTGDAKRSEMYRLATLVYPRSAAAEAYRTLRANVDFTAVDDPVRTLLVTSAVPSEGKTVTAANLAIAFALAGRRVLLVDADLRRPGIHTIFNLPNTEGLTTLLYRDEANVDLIAHSNLHERLRVLTSGPLPPNPAELAGSERMHRVFERIKATADILIVDSSPLQAVTDSAILGSYMDGTLLVIDSSRTHRATIRQAREALAKANARVIGVVLNRVANRRYAEDHPYSGYYDETTTAAVVSPAMSTTARRAGIVKTVSRLLKHADARPGK
jgi:succinoglycan biosynthesis transport protein ExoP